MVAGVGAEEKNAEEKECAGKGSKQQQGEQVQKLQLWRPRVLRLLPARNTLPAAQQAGLRAIRAT